MMVDATPAMHRDFPRWYSAISVGDETTRQIARWTAVSALSASADQAMVEALVRLAFGTRQPPSSDAVAKIHAAIHKQDDTFDPGAAARELQVLAGACLVVTFDRNDDIGAASALSVTTAGLDGGRTLELPMDLLALAESGLVRIAEARRARPELSRYVAADIPEFDFEDAGVKANEGTEECMTEAFTMAAASVKGVLHNMATRQANAIRAADRFIRIQDEELQMLWWLMGGRSFDMDCAFGSVPCDAAPLIFAKELANSTVALPGPLSIKPLLTRAGVKERKKLTVASALNAASSDWLWQLVEERDPSPVTQPLHFAIKRHQEAGGGDTWVSNWAAVVSMDDARRLSALSLAMLFYREQLLVRLE